MITFDPESLKKRLAELEEELGKPGFWDDQQRAAKISAEHARVSRRLARYERLRQEYEDFNKVKRPQREANLRAALDEYLRFGLEAGIFYVN